MASPNLVITAFSSNSSEAIPGGVVTFTFTVKNIGDADTTFPGVPGSGTSFTSLYRDGDPNKIDFAEVPILAPGESYTGTLEVEYSAFFGGPSQTFYASADDDNGVPLESDEDDNTGPDIVIAPPSGGPLFTPNDDDADLPRPGEYSALAGNDTVRGTSGVDIVRGRAGDDTIFGRGGDDRLTGDNGEDLLNGGGGDDILRGGNDADTLLGMSGDDTLYGGPGADTLRGGDGDDVLEGRGGADILRGGPGSDVIRGGKHDDNIKGGGGADTLRGGTGADVISGGKHDDDIKGGGGADKLFGEAGDDVIRGGRHDDKIGGGGGDDRLFGESGSDELIGGNGRDILNGNGGNDSLTGGAGGDVFVFGRSGKTDTVTDFNKQRDKLDMDALAGDWTKRELLDRFEQVGDDAVFSAKGTTIVLEDVDVDDLGTGIFGSADDLIV